MSRKGRKKSLQRQSRVVLEPSELIQAMRKYLSPLFCPKDQRPKPKKVHFQGDGSRRFRCLPTELWGQFGKEVPISVGTQKIDVSVPSAADLLGELILLEESACIASWDSIKAAASKNLDEQYQDWLNNDLEFLHKVDALFALFAAIPAANQAKHLAKFREFLAVELLLYDVLQQVKNSPVDLTNLQRKALLGGLKTQIRSDLSLGTESELLATSEETSIDNQINATSVWIILCYDFFDIYYWEEAVLPRNSIREFLPKGMSHPPEVSNSSEQAKTARENPIAESMKAVKKTNLDPERELFYRDVLGCKRVVETQGAFKERNYVAFLLKSGSGQMFAILDCPELENAVYIFRIEKKQQSEESDWVQLATQTKADVLATSGSGGPFLRRIFHGEGWQERVTKFLESH